MNYSWIFVGRRLLAAVVGVLAVTGMACGQNKPIAVVSLASVDGLLNDVSYVAKAAGYGDFATQISQQATMMTNGIDRSRPLGLALLTDGDQFIPLGLVPVKDLAAVLRGLEMQLGKPQPMDDGILELQGPRPIYLKENNGWCFVGQTPGSLRKLPENPAGLLEGLNETFDIGIRVHVQNIPQAYRDIAINQIKVGIEDQLENLPEDDADAAVLQREMLKNQVRQWETLLSETDQLTFGINIDQAAGGAFLDTIFTAVTGTGTARKLAMMQDSRTNFSGFSVDGAAITMNLSGRIADDDIEQAKTTLAGLKKQAAKQIENDADLPDEASKQAAIKLIDGFFAVIEETLATGKMDGAGSAIINGTDLTLVYGTHVASGDKLEASLKELVELAKKDPNFPGIKFNAAQHNGLRFHAMQIPIPEEEEARKLFGDKLNVAIGVGEDQVCVGIGNDCVKYLRTCIDGCTKQKRTDPFHTNVCLSQVLRLAASIGEEESLDSIAKVLENCGGKDNVVISAKPVSDGAMYRIEIQEGVIEAIGNAAGQRAAVQ
ncbi:MAG: hypothetical protein R3E01_07890 [Pirellulaceae bacterium]|nr:hypothetical protein [Planctomycetales bacterium]